MTAAQPTLAIFDVGGPEILIVLLVALLLFGSQRLPELARNLGKSIREFKKATAGLEEELKRALETPPPAPRPRLPAAPATVERPIEAPPHDPPPPTPPTGNGPPSDPLG